MTWQKVTAVETEASMKVKAKGGDAVDVPNATWDDRPTYTLKKKSGDTYEFTSYSAAMANYDRRAGEPGGASDVFNGNVKMSEDIAQALDDGKEVWVNVHFGDDSSYAMFWAEGAPWDGGDVHDDYGIEDTY